jgi:hypothetical protein
MIPVFLGSLLAHVLFGPAGVAILVAIVTMAIRGE